MSANTRPAKDTTKKVELCLLFTNAVGLIEKGARSTIMIDELLSALQLFKQGKLGTVLPMASEYSLRGVLERRLATRQKMRMIGTEAIYEEILDRLPKRIQRGLAYAGIRTLQQLLENDPFNFQKIKGLGERSVDTIEETLRGYGIGLRMDADALRQLFSGIGSGPLAAS
ncbi:MAG TPA: DNA-directed RNA polymerase subunit alpha C-terminal domain-containing protein [Candidatus Paceibacterota bacterium]|nr:DNA-directed RNA polymerase subunit alpha C-terminal domain-containing protein [Candidatus Paceibacterota bacterium]